MTLSPREASELLRRHGLAPRQRLGQNFVVDPNTVRRIARLAEVGPDDHVVEIGAGLGSLTLALLETGARVTAIELDDGLVEVLRETVPAAEIVAGDARQLDWAALLDGRPAVVVANLPYYAATSIVADLLDDVPLVERLLVMVQAEVGERLAAGPGTKAYGAVSVKVAYWAEAAVVGRVPPTVFLPRPKVDSALVAIRRRPVPAGPPSVPAADLFRLVRAGFGQRRKTLRRSLTDLADRGRLRRGRHRPGRARRAARRRRVGPPRTGRARARGRRAMTAAPNQVRAPAKLTLSLRITGVRADGYHLLDAEMVTLELADTLTFADGDGLTVGGPFAAGVPTDDSNLVRRALRLVDRRAAVHVHKAIPAGGGLGGGSADAAAVLRWAGVDDVGVATALGADVPFCLVGGRARVRGVGEQVEPLPPIDRTFTLVTPPVAVSTPAGLPGLGRAGRPDRRPQRPRARGPGRGPRAGPVARPDPGGRR